MLIALRDEIRYFCIKLILKKPDIVVSFGNGLGDDLLCTILVKQLKTAGYKNVWMKTRHPDIFKGNLAVDKVVKKNHKGKASYLIERYLNEINAPSIYPNYTKYDTATDRDIIPQKHIVLIMCDLANVTYPAIIKPHFYLTETEKKNGRLFKNQICIQSTGKGSKNYMANKEWFPERFADLAENLKSQFTVIQIGLSDDYLIPGAIDMRGKTDIRKTAAILYNSVFFVGIVGFLMHLSRAVDCRSVIIYGGRESPAQSGYDSNINLYSDIHCAPCWYWNSCAYNKKCMNIISVSDVLDAISLLKA